MADTNVLTAQVIEVYIASFNRAPDYDGLTYWVEKMNMEGWSIDEVASSFFDSAEVASLYPTSLADADFINQIYNNVLGRDADTAGSEYWLQEMQNGITKDKMIVAIINGANADSGDAQDKLLLSNKKDVGTNFAVTLELNDLALARTSMASVTTTSLSVDLAKDTQNMFSDSLVTTLTTLVGTAADDLLTSTATLAHVYSLEGNDIITTADGADVIVAGSGDDTVYSNAGNDVIHGRDGNDTIYANAGDDTIYGNEDNDSLHGEAGDDTIYGNDGDDYLYGDDGNDMLVGNNGNDFIYGGAGSNTIYGNDGDDNIYTGDGTNFVDAGAGNDFIYGGSGIDSIYGGAGNDILYGYAQNDILDGLIGDDTIYAGLGNDIANGNDGADTLYGNDGDDRIDGEKGDDTIDGGLGTDTLTGGEGADTFVFTSQESTLLTLDVITDFEYTIDKIKLANQGTEIISTSSVNVSSAISLQTAANLAMTEDGSVNGLVKWFVYADNTYILEDLSADVAFNNTSDIIIKLQGIVDLTGLDSITIAYS